LKYFIWSLNAKLQRREQLLARQVQTNFTFKRYSHTTHYAAFHHINSYGYKRYWIQIKLF